VVADVGSPEGWKRGERQAREPCVQGGRGGTSMQAGSVGRGMDMGPGVQVWGCREEAAAR